VIDAAAVSLCGDNKLPLLAFELETEGNIGRAVAGEKIGTLVCRVDEVDAQ
jgi:uridylate kinase